jgi:ubiquinone/menaquinone biosynthesis C-methylase UbiE
MEFLLAGEKLQRCRTAFLDRIPTARNILLVGEGHGRCLIECRRRFPNARIVCIDASEKMLVQARRRMLLQMDNSCNVEFVRADVLAWVPPTRKFDLIATNFFLDCFPREQLEKVIRLLATAATPSSNWLLADFQLASRGLKRVRSRLILWSMYSFFRAVTCLPASHLAIPDDFLIQAGYTLNRRVESEWGLLHSDWWQAP